MADARKDRRTLLSLKIRYKSATLEDFIERYSYPDGADCADSLEADRAAAEQPGAPPYAKLWISV